MSENDVRELTADELEMIAGGEDQGPISGRVQHRVHACARCGSWDTDTIEIVQNGIGSKYVLCHICQYKNALYENKDVSSGEALIPANLK